MNDQPPTQPPASEAATRAPDLSAGATRSALPGAAPAADGQPSAEAVPTELRDHPRYRVLELLGQGGMGAVYKAEHRHMGRVVALKVISPALVGSDAAVRRFHQEVQAAARLHHPNIVTAYDADQAGDPTSWSWSSSRERAWTNTCRRKRPLPSRRPATAPGRRPWACSTPTSRAWSTATSSRTT